MPPNPVNKIGRERIQASERRLQEAVDLLTRCKNCGLDVKDREEVLAFLFDRLEAIKKNFMEGDTPQGVKRARATDQ